jgi:hypothetical protein
LVTSIKVSKSYFGMRGRCQAFAARLPHPGEVLLISRRVPVKPWRVFQISPGMSIFFKKNINLQHVQFSTNQTG